MRRLFASASLIALAGSANAADLTLHRVMLSAAGVGYFEFSAPVQGTGTIGLDVTLDQVDDVLSSLAVFDDHGGVGSMELPGRDDTRQAFADVPFDEAQLNAPADMLRALRGQDISVAGPQSMQGSIVSVETVPPAPVPMPQSPERQVASQPARTRVTLLTGEGFRQFILEDAGAIRLTDAALNANIGAALRAARQQAGAAMRHITLRTAGKGDRIINVAYVAVAPLWKASYRVVVPASGGDHARVQGWAVLENQSGVDWKGVDLTLQAGNPVTFHQDIYASYYADRPNVPVDVLGRLLPAPDERATEAGVIVRAQQKLLRERNGPASTMPVQGAARPSFRSMQRGNYSDMPMAAGAAIMPSPMAFAADAQMAAPADETQATETPIDTAFHIATPIDLARGNSASVPIIDQSVPAEQLDLLPADSTTPITALRLTNNSGTSLPGGILTLYSNTPGQGAAFAGDARLSGLPAGESRLLAFAQDLRTTAIRRSSSGPDQVLRVKMLNGILTEMTLHRTVMTATLTAPAREARRVLVEFNKSNGRNFSLADAAGGQQEQTASAWRVRVDLKPGETRSITAYADTPESQSQALLPNSGDFNNDFLVAVLGTPGLDQATRDQLKQLGALRDAEAGKRAALQKLIDERDAVNADEQRLRSNLQAVAGPGNLHDKLLAELDTDEADLARLAHAIKPAQEEVAQANQALREAVEKLTF